jgi:flavin reductase (DIM6/NTAB) family NADH-FMN oxidoreductase RutF
MEINPNDLPWRSVYKLLIGSVVPRPIGWISSINPEGQPNLAPFSFFNAVAANPPHVLFSPLIRGTDQRPKDTLRNVRSTGEFVVNIVTEGLAGAMNITATELSPNINEFELAGLTAAPSALVRPPRVAESPVHFECVVTQIIELGDRPGSGSIVIGQVVHFHVSENVLFDGDKIDIKKLRPIGRLAGSAYCRVTDMFDLTRPPSQINR